MHRKLILFVISVTFSVWWGGLSLFPTVILPAVQETPYSSYIQYEFTKYLNVFGFLCTGGIFLFLLAFKDRSQKLRKVIFVYTFILFILITTLIVIHPSLKTPLGIGEDYSIRMLYIVISSASWVMGIFILWKLTSLPYDESKNNTD